MLNSILERIGNTPLLRLKNFEKKFSINAHIYAKIEYCNPFGSIKDRSALQIIQDAEKERILTINSTIIEATSGNMGIALSGIGAIKGYKTIIVMPENMSEKRKKLINSYGAKLILTPEEKGMSGAIKIAEDLSKKELNIYYPNQFENYSSVKAHYLTTAPEIHTQMKARTDVIIAGIGTGATISGIGKYMKEKNPEIEIIGVEPASSPIITKGYSGNHGIQGIGAGFIPKILIENVIDKVLTVSDDEAIEECSDLIKSEGIFVGISSGAILAACKQIVKIEKYSNKNIVLIFADNGERYI